MSEFLAAFLQEAAAMFLAMSPYLMIGMIMAGVMHALIRREFIFRHVGRSNFSSILKAALFGVPLPLCSCGVVPMAVFMEKSGASKPAVVSFLIATPQTGLDSITAAYGMMGPAMAFVRALAAFVSGIIGGAVTALTDRIRFSRSDGNPVHARLEDDLIAAGAGSSPDGCLSPIQSASHCSSGCCTEGWSDLASSHKANGKFALSAEAQECACSVQNSASSPGKKEGGNETAVDLLKKRASAAFRYGFIEFTDDIAWPFLVGLAAAALITMLIPDGFFEGSALARGFSGMLIMLLIGIPFYTCSTSSIPIAVAFMLKGISPGAAFVFLMAGPAANAASLAILHRQFGLRMTIQYLGSIIVGGLLFGGLVDMLYFGSGIDFFRPAAAELLSGEDREGGIVSLTASMLFLFLLLVSFYRKGRRVFEKSFRRRNG